MISPIWLLEGSYVALIIMVYGLDGFFWVAWSAAGLQMTDIGGYREPPNLVEGGYKENADASAMITPGSGARW